jgi:hypothetical protein
MENRTSAAKADYGSVIYGTAELVPFLDPVLTQTLTPWCTVFLPVPEFSRGLFSPCHSASHMKCSSACNAKHVGSRSIQYSSSTTLRKTGPYGGTLGGAALLELLPKFRGPLRVTETL